MTPQEEREIDWLAKRYGKFTASQIHKLFVSSKTKGVLFGDVAMTYIQEKVHETISLESKKTGDFKQTEWGNKYEPEARQVFERLTGFKGIYYGVENPKFFPYGDDAGGSPDWESLDGTEGADFKCPFNGDKHVSNFVLKGVEDFENKKWEYYCQGQMNMLIRGWKKFYYVSYDPRPIESSLRLFVLEMYPCDTWVTEFQERLASAIEMKPEIIKRMRENKYKFA